MNIPFRMPIPMFMLRKIVRQNPWLLADNGVVRETQTLVIGPLEIEIESSTELLPKQKAKLQAEADAGTLFPDRRKQSGGAS